MMLRLVERFWAGPERTLNRSGELAVLDCLTFARACYWLNLGFTLHACARWWGVDKMSESFLPIWPTVLLQSLPWPGAIWWFATPALFASIAVALMPQQKWLRVCVFCSVFMFSAVGTSLTRIHHQDYLWLTMLLFLALVPSRCGSKDEARKTIDIVWAAIATGLFYYSLAGIGKLFGLIQAARAGVSSTFRLDVAPTMLHKKGLEGLSEPPLLGTLALDYPMLVSLGFYAVIVLELGSFAAAFSRPILRYWIFALALFHFATWATMDVYFGRASLVMLLWALVSPFGVRPRWLDELHVYLDRFPGISGRGWMRSASSP